MLELTSKRNLLERTKNGKSGDEHMTLEEMIVNPCAPTYKNNQYFLRYPYGRTGISNCGNSYQNLKKKIQDEKKEIEFLEEEKKKLEKEVEELEKEEQVCYGSIDGFYLFFLLLCVSVFLFFLLT